MTIDSSALVAVLFSEPGYLDLVDTMLQDATGTIMLTERISAVSYLGNDGWAEIANERLAELDIDARIDHRSLEAQGLTLEPQSQIGAPAKRI